MTSIGEALVTQLAERGVETVFGIPGVHTVELYRGLAASGIRHVTPRHEQGAGFMADGYARVSGKPGVAFVITGPGLTNTLTPMAQARADSIPMLVVSGVNRLSSLGKGLGCLHELPNQHAMVSTVALVSAQVRQSDDLSSALTKAFLPFSSGRPGPTHVEIPLDVAGGDYVENSVVTETGSQTQLEPDQVSRAQNALEAAKAPVILAGGGSVAAADLVRDLAERLDAPVVQTVNARGVMYDHPLGVPASPSLRAVRDLIEGADVVLAVGTELGPTDYDMYATGSMARMQGLIRIDCCNEQIGRHPAEIGLQGDAGVVLDVLIADLRRKNASTGAGADRAAQTRTAAFEELGQEYQSQVQILDAMRVAAPGSVMVGDSTQPIYAGNLYYDHDRAGGWFNAATGYGALGYAIPAAIGAAIADPGARVICIIGDGGAQFSLPEIMAAVDEKLPIIFVVWNNHGYREIATSMQDVGVTVVGCDPTPPNFEAAALSFGIPHQKCGTDPQAVAAAVTACDGITGPCMIEIEAPVFTPS
ncbi:5-guanidino-2-oxopentanoate decarboxylase [Parasedimentitalea maritima]|uniref:5-guanidino-2-oxopentanoate decarboxylase n=1 Tax=Parasedimentitalea maritima TaxID=2578117 RepID=A0ABY2UTM9_9RHOB|nr:5-guanidino-2-oxopentanoate decarboxylase [Zongyanglinia marina]TLP62647.1 5-guanidino-2-oxopentanoate decarboxylase [Zongyanglinia marina]